MTQVILRNEIRPSDDFGGYMLLEANRNLVVLGERYDATLDDIEAFFIAVQAA
jgi:hypothetical protein